MIGSLIRNVYCTICSAMLRSKQIALVLAMATLILAGVPLVIGQGRSPEAKSEATEDAFSGYQSVRPGITPPKATRSPDPPYPELPADTDPRGVVVMLIGVDSRGHVGPVHVVRSSAQAFEKSAVETVKTWRFKPARKDGRPVPVQITVEMNFAK